jgi:acyl-CoA synthetase (AMP-forming)/AMP-acid ligase II
MAFEASGRFDAPDNVDRLDARKARVTPDERLIVQFTSGTTAAPKGVELRQDQLLRSATGMTERLGMTAQDRFFSPMPFFHIGGSTASVLTAMVCGATLHFTDRFNAGAALATIAGERCTCVCGVETMFVDMLAHGDFARLDLSCIRTGWTNYNESVFAALPGMLNVYALTECSSLVTICRWSDPLERRITSGYALDGLEVRIVDPETRKELPHGVAGLIRVRGWCVTAGYYKQPSLTADAISSDGWLDTGDYGQLRPTGDLLYLGRYKDVLRVGGENVSSVEVEAILNSHPAVLRSAVVPVPHARLKQIPFAFVLLREGGSATGDEITAFCAERLATFKVPRHVAFVMEFPMTESGKIQKRLLVQSAEDLMNNSGSAA